MIGVICVMLAVSAVSRGSEHSQTHYRSHRRATDGVDAGNIHFTPDNTGSPHNSKITTASDSKNSPTFRFSQPSFSHQSPDRSSFGDMNGNIEVPSNRGLNNHIFIRYSWRQVDFVFHDMADREEMIRSEKFIPRYNLINDVDVYQEGQTYKVFVTLPRLLHGMPVTLATVSDQQRNGSHLLAPYPDWASQKPGPNGMSTIYRTHMDQCGRLWVLDSGSDGIDGSYTDTASPAQVIIYDVRNNDQVIGRYPIPSSIAEDVIMLVTIQVDARAPDCSDAFAYIADSLAYRMIVFSLHSKEFWTISNIQFFPYPDHSKHTIGGVSFALGGGMYGIFGMALGPKFGDNHRYLYFHSFSSVKQSWADTEDLRNGTLWKQSLSAKPSAFNLFGGSRPSQSIVSTMSQDGIMFFVLTATSELVCWNSRDKFDSKNIVRLIKDDTALQANSGIKVYKNTLYLVTNRLQNYIKDKVNENEVTYRLLVGDVRQLTRGTRCEVTDRRYQPNSENVL